MLSFQASLPTLLSDLKKTSTKPASTRRSIPLFTLESQIKRSLRRHLKSLGFQKDEKGLLKPPEMTKDCFRKLHAAQRRSKLIRESDFIRKEWPQLKRYFADGRDISPEKIVAKLELVQTGTWQARLFRLACNSWSVPVSQGYGRRMRFLVWDDFNGKLIGLIALGDPVFNLHVRDESIGWNLKQKENLLVNLLDAYVLGAIPPYNMLLGGKLVACLICSKEVKDIFAKRYGHTRGIISKRKKHAELCLVTTTSALGRSSVYNRLKLGGTQLFTPIGFTSGWGHFHIPENLFGKMRQYLEDTDDNYLDNHRFGDGPNWKLRAVRKVLGKIGLSPDLMRHGIPREVFICQLASNAYEFLRQKTNKPNFRGLRTAEEISQMAIERWMAPRAVRRGEYRAWLKDDFAKRLVANEEAIWQQEDSQGPQQENRFVTSP